MIHPSGHKVDDILILLHTFIKEKHFYWSKPVIMTQS